MEPEEQDIGCWECTHEEPNVVIACPICNAYTMIVRRVTNLPKDSVIGYDPICGVTVCL